MFITLKRFVIVRTSKYVVKCFYVDKQLVIFIHKVLICLSSFGVYKRALNETFWKTNFIENIKRLETVQTFENA